MLSRIRSNLLLGAAALGGLALSINSAAAQGVPQAEQLRVEAVVGEVCTVTSALLSFGTEYNGTATVQGSGGIEISCVTSTDLGVALGAGQAGNGAGLRTMRNGSNDLLYTLYTNSPGGDPWETGEIVQTNITGTDTVEVHGVISPIGQPDPLINGEYSDEVTITLTF
jgi:spore coat protein U-like protein